MQTQKKSVVYNRVKRKSDSRLFISLFIHQIYLGSYWVLKSVLGSDKLVCQNERKEQLELISMKK